MWFPLLLLVRMIIRCRFFLLLFQLSVLQLLRLLPVVLGDATVGIVVPIALVVVPPPSMLFVKTRFLTSCSSRAAAFSLNTRRCRHPQALIISRRNLLVSSSSSSSISRVTSEEEAAGTEEGNVINMKIVDETTSTTTTTTTTSSGRIQMKHVHFPTVDSTQNKCQELLALHHQHQQQDTTTSKNNVLVVTASEQTQGRGTNQRSWTSVKGNTFVTIAFPMDILSDSIQAFTLLPLKVGTIIASCVHDVSFHNTKKHVISLKWPNDVLLNDLKLAGVLIETFAVNNNNNTTNVYDYYFIVGIGVNVAYTPTVFCDGRRARDATCLADYWNTTDTNDDASLLMAMNIANKMLDWLNYLLSISSSSSSSRRHDAAVIERNAIISSWENWAQPWMGQPIEIRDPSSTNSQQSVVIPIGIQSDGQLKVKYVNNNQIGLLPMTDYLL